MAVKIDIDMPGLALVTVANMPMGYFGIVRSRPSTGTVVWKTGAGLVDMSNIGGSFLPDFIATMTIEVLPFPRTFTVTDDAT